MYRRLSICLVCEVAVNGILIYYCVFCFSKGLFIYWEWIGTLQRRLTVSVYSCVLPCLFLFLWGSTTQSLCVRLEGRRNSCLFSTRHQDCHGLTGMPCGVWTSHCPSSLVLWKHSHLKKPELPSHRTVCCAMNPADQSEGPIVKVLAGKN